MALCRLPLRSTVSLWRLFFSMLLRHLPLSPSQLFFSVCRCIGEPFAKAFANPFAAIFLPFAVDAVGKEKDPAGKQFSLGITSISCFPGSPCLPPCIANRLPLHWRTVCRCICEPFADAPVTSVAAKSELKPSSSSVFSRFPTKC